MWGLYCFRPEVLFTCWFSNPEADQHLATNFKTCLHFILTNKLSTERVSVSPLADSTSLWFYFWPISSQCPTPKPGSDCVVCSWNRLASISPFHSCNSSEVLMLHSVLILSMLAPLEETPHSSNPHLSRPEPVFSLFFFLQLHWN